jgi:hypothetical protein
MDQQTQTIYVLLKDEGVDVWRPVSAKQVGPAVFEIMTQPEPATEEWEFRPGTRVKVEERFLTGGSQRKRVLVAVGIA